MKNQSGQAVVELLVISGVLIAVTTLFLFSILLSTLSVILESESFEALACIAESRPRYKCEKNYINRVQALPFLKVEQVTLSAADPEFTLNAKISGPFKSHFYRHERILIE